MMKVQQMTPLFNLLRLRNLIRMTVCFSICLPSIVAAQAVLEEVTVTAQKRTESLQDVPLSVTAISNKKLEEMNITEWRDLQIPGVYIGEAGDTRSQFIRGIGSVPLERGFEMAVPLYYDGIYSGRGRHNTLGLWDIEGIEILKGPQPTHVGKNAIGGAVLVKSAKPTDVFEAILGLDYEFEAEEVTVDAAVSGPVSDNLKARLAVKFRDMNGWGVNIAEGNVKVPQHEDIKIRGSFIFEPQDNIEIYGKIEYADMEQIGGVRTRFDCAPGAPLDPAVGGDCSRDNQTVTMGFDPASTPIGFFNEVPLEHQVPLRIFLEHKGGSLTIDWRFDDFTMTSNTGYYEYDNEVFVKPDFNTALFPLLIANTPENYEQFSQEIRLASTTDGNLEWLVGAYFDTSDMETNSQVSLPALIIPGFAPQGLAFRDKLTVDQDSWAVFGEAVFHVTEQFTARFGARYTEVKKDSLHPHDFFLTNPDNTQFRFGPGSFVLDESRKDTSFQPAVTGEWTPNDDSMYYASWKEGFKAGGFAINGRPPSGGFDPEEVTSWEVGAKYTLLEGAATLNLAAFRSEYTNLQVSTFNPALGIFLTRNAEESRSQGFEAEFAWAASEALTLQVSGAYLDAEYIDFSGVNCYLNPPQTTGCTIPEGGTILDGTQNLGGSPTPYAPEFSAAFSANYETPVSGNLLFKGFLSVFYTDEFHITSRGDKDVFQGSYAKLDLRLAIASQDGKWEVALVGRNLTDKLTAHMIEDTPGDPNSNWANIDRPRQLGIQLKFRL